MITFLVNTRSSCPQDVKFEKIFHGVKLELSMSLKFLSFLPRKMPNISADILNNELLLHKKSVSDQPVRGPLKRDFIIPIESGYFFYLVS